MDIRRAAADRIQHDLVDEAHDGRVLDVITPDLVIQLLLAAADFERLEIDIALIGERRHLVVDLLERPVDRLLKLIVLDHDGFDAEAGAESHLIDRMEIGRIGDGHEQPLAAPEDWQHAVLG